MADTMKKTKYNLWQNTGFMLCLAWKLRPSVIYICVALALMSAGSTVTGLLLAPSLLLKLAASRAVDNNWFILRRTDDL